MLQGVGERERKFPPRAAAQEQRKSEKESEDDFSGTEVQSWVLRGSAVVFLRLSKCPVLH
jgi:hypothetical protein